MSIALDPVKVLPEAISINNFSFLEMSNLVSCCRVSKNWQRLANDSELYELIAKRMFNGETPNVPSIKAFLQELKSQKLKSNEEIIDRVKGFINRISLGKNARFRCLISTGSQYQAISIEFKSTEETVAKILNTRSAYEEDITDFEFKDDCIAINGIGDGSLGTRPPVYRPKSQSFSNAQIMRERIIACTTASRPFDLDARAFIIINLAVFTGTYVLPIRGPLQAVVRFPALPHTGLDHQTDMEHTITHMVQVKLDKLASQASRRNAVLYTAAAVFVLSAYLFNLYLTSVD